MLTVVLERFSEDTVILAEMVYLNKPLTSMRPEPVVDYVRRAEWGMLYADDASIRFVIAAGVREHDGGHRRGLPTPLVNHVGKEDRDHVHACTTYRGRWYAPKKPRKFTNKCNTSPSKGAP